MDQQETADMVVRLNDAPPEVAGQLLQEILKRMGPSFQLEEVTKRPKDLETSIHFINFTMPRYPNIYTVRLTMSYICRLLPLLVPAAAVAKGCRDLGKLPDLVREALKTFLLSLRHKDALQLLAVADDLVLCMQDLAEVWLYLCHTTAPAEPSVTVTVLPHSAVLMGQPPVQLSIASLSECMLLQHSMTDIVGSLAFLVAHTPVADRLLTTLAFQVKALPGATKLTSLATVNTLLSECDVPSNGAETLLSLCLQLLAPGAAENAAHADGGAGTGPSAPAKWPAFRTEAFDAELGQCLYRLTRLQRLTDHVRSHEFLGTFVAGTEWNLHHSPSVFLKRVLCGVLCDLIREAGRVLALVPVACQALQVLLPLRHDAALHSALVPCVQAFLSCVGRAPGAASATAAQCDEGPAAKKRRTEGWDAEAQAAALFFACQGALPAARTHVGAALVALRRGVQDAVPPDAPDLRALQRNAAGVAVAVRALLPFASPARTAALRLLAQWAQLVSKCYAGAPPVPPGQHGLLPPLLLLLRELHEPRDVGAPALAPDTVPHPQAPSPSKAQAAPSAAGGGWAADPEVAALHMTSLETLQTLVQYLSKADAGASVEVVEAEVGRALTQILASPCCTKAEAQRIRRSTFEAALGSRCVPLQVAAIEALPLLLTGHPGTFAPHRDAYLAGLRGKLDRRTAGAVLTAIAHTLAPLVHAWYPPAAPSSAAAEVARASPTPAPGRIVIDIDDDAGPAAVPDLQPWCPYFHALLFPATLVTPDAGDPPGAAPGRRVACTAALTALLSRVPRAGFRSQRAFLQSVLALISDPDRAVRRHVVGIVEALVQRETEGPQGAPGAAPSPGPLAVMFHDRAAAGGQAGELFDHVVAKLKEEQQEQGLATLIEMVGRIAIASGARLFTNAFFTLLTYLDPVHPIHIRAHAMDQLHEVATRKGTEIAELFLQFKELYAQVVQRLPSAHMLVNEVANILDMSLKEFLESSLVYTVPPLVLQCDLGVLQAIARNVDRNLDAIVTEHLGAVYAHVLLQNEDPKGKHQKKDALTFLATQILGDKLSIGQLAARVESPMLKHVVTFLGEYAETAEPRSHQAPGGPQTDPYLDPQHALNAEARGRASRALQQLIVLKTEGETQQPSQDSETFLCSKFLGLVDTIGTNLGLLGNEPELSLRQKGCCLRALNNLILMLGSKTKTFVTKIVCTLEEIALKCPDLQTAVCQSWPVFLRALDTETLRGNAPQIVVRLSRMLQYDEDTVVAALNYLFVDARAADGKDMDWLHLEDFLPRKSPALLKKLHGALSRRAPAGFDARLQKSLEGMHHPNPNVRAATVTGMKGFLLQYGAQVVKHVNAHPDRVGDAINTLVPLLLQSCAQTPSITHRLHVAECLGVLGAIDPARLQLEPNPSFETIHDDIQFAIKIITDHLLRFIRDPSNYKVVDRAAYAIQELIKFCALLSTSSQDSLSRDSPSSRGEDIAEIVQRCRWWTELNMETRSTLTPYLKTSYYIHVNNQRAYASPLYKREDPCRVWLKQWICQLIERTSGKRHAVFKVLRAVMKEDPPMCLFILPYLVLNVCMHGTDSDRKDITTEIMTVVGHAQHCGEHVQIVFQLLDEMTHWVDDHRHNFTRSQRTSTEEKQSYNRVKDTLEGCRRDKLAKAAFGIGACARAYMYYEEFLRGLRDGIAPTATSTQSSQGRIRWCDPGHVSFLQRIYSFLHEPDGLTGIATLRATTTIREQTLDYETALDWTNALNCYELQLQEDPMSAEFNTKLLACQRNLGQFAIMLRHAEGVLARLPAPAESGGAPGGTLAEDLHSFSIQAAWRLGDWGLVEEKLQQCHQHSFEVGLAKSLLHLRSSARPEFQDAITQTRAALLPALGAACMESYERAYPTIVQLQMLSDLERAFELLAADKSPEGSRVSRPEDPQKVLQQEWQARITLTEYTPHTREPLLSLHRAVYGMHGMRMAAADAWLGWAKLSRKAGHHQAAASAILQAGREQPPSGFYTEQAKLLYSQGHQTTAIAIVESPPKDLGVVEGANFPKARARMQLLAVKWNQATNQKQANEVIADYEQVVKTHENLEKGHFYLAAFLDKLLARYRKEMVAPGTSIVSRTNTSFQENMATLLPKILQSYGAALTRGSKHLYHSLPRMLTLWLDYADELCDTSEKNRRVVRSGSMPVLDKMHNEMRLWLQKLQPAQWLSCLSQVVSRICHRDPRVFDVISSIVVTITAHFPQQALWAVLAVCNSTNASRKKNGEMLYNAVKQQTNVKGILDDGHLLFKGLIQLCDFHVEKGLREFQLERVPDLKKVCKRLPLQVIVPLQAQLTAGLPDAAGVGIQQRIHSIDKRVEIMPSLQRPRKIAIYSQTGARHPFLCKPKDDLRKDSRMMEFNTMINRLLKKEEESRRRKLYLRTFAVIPLNDECGLIEWVSHVAPFRTICDALYKSFDKYVPNSEIRDIVNKQEKAGTSKVMIYRDYLLPKFPPMFYRWFLNHFPQPNQWFQARLAYCKTTSVWSMVGSVVGLGDRHGENILFDDTTGDCVHVDFSCLFDKGQQLEIPECVPFRLTPNMRDALGLTGVEGVYRKSCETTMKTLRDNKDTLMGVLETFVHDPLLEWHNVKGQIGGGADIENQQASRIMRKIERRLCGFIDNEHLPLSVEGQVQKLVSQATSQENLAHMYIWWMPWL